MVRSIYEPFYSLVNAIPKRHMGVTNTTIRAASGGLDSGKGSCVLNVFSSLEVGSKRG